MTADQIEARLARLERIQERQIDILQDVNATVARLEQHLSHLDGHQQEILGEIEKIEKGQDDQSSQRYACLKECNDRVSALDTKYQAKLRAVEPFTRAIKYVTVGLSTILVGAIGTWLSAKVGRL